jgi:antigen flippase
VWWMGLPGVAPAIAVAAAFGLAASWWYARRLAGPPVRLSWDEMSHEAKVLLGFGLAFLVTGLAGSVVQYALRMILVRDGGLGMAGEFQASATLAIVYVTFILQAMSQDFYPRLTAVAQDDTVTNRLVNEQSELSLLLAGPGVLATAALAPWLINLLFSDQFVLAAEVLRWQCLGVLLRVASWPIGFVLLARGEGRWFVVIELVTHIVHVCAFWALVEAQGLRGAAFGLVVCYLLYLPMVYLVVRRLSGFGWSGAVKGLLVVNLGAFAAVMALVYLLPPVAGPLVGTAVAAALGVFAYHRLARLTELPLARRVVAGIARTLRRR